MSQVHRGSGFKHDVCKPIAVKHCAACRTNRITYYLFKSERAARDFMDSRGGESRGWLYNHREWHESFLRCEEHIILMP